MPLHAGQRRVAAEIDQPAALLAGDFNAEPQDAKIIRIVSSLPRTGSAKSFVISACAWTTSTSPASGRTDFLTTDTSTSGSTGFTR